MTILNNASEKLLHQTETFKVIEIHGVSGKTLSPITKLYC